MKHFTLYKQENAYASFPHLALDTNGDLLLVFRVAGALTAKAALTGTHTHQDIDSRILFMRSSDGGTTWSPPVTITRGSTQTGITPSDPALTVLQNGRLMVRFARWQLVSCQDRDALPAKVDRHFVRGGQVGKLLHSGFMVSDDGGEHWQPLQTECLPDLDFGMASRESVHQLADGTLILAVYGGYPHYNETAWLLRSWDNGATWRDISHIAGQQTPHAYRKMPNYNEVSLAVLDRQTILALLRVDHLFVTDENTFMSEGGIGELEWTISYDAGFTWELPQKTGIWGQPGHLLLLRDGTMLVTYGHRRTPYGIQATRVTLTDNREWHLSHHVILRDDGAGWDLGYPASVELPDGDIYSVYYTHDADRIRYIAGTRWSLGDADVISDVADKGKS